METTIGGLGAYVVARRTQLGMSMSALALKAGLSKSELSGLEHGKIKLPGADKRRRLADALGVSHAELLIAAGEITADEIVATATVYDPKRKAAVAPFSENSPAAKIVDILRTLSDADASVVLGMARHLDDARRGVVHPADRDTVVNVNDAKPAQSVGS